ncbi:MAG TPA: hypothetical protein VJ836_05805 [Candidatus Saccharimonadales bacterium]|nr:hypothetical protein [Candidatus Saccharimonadales bacterium]
MHESAPEFGLYRPLTADSVQRILPMTETVQQRLTAYFSQHEITAQAAVRPDFGITYVSKSIVARHMATHVGEPFDTARLIDEINTIVRPVEAETLYVPFWLRSLAGVGVTENRPAGVFLKFGHRSPAFVQLQQQRAYLQEALDASGLSVPLSSAGHISILSFGGPNNRPRFTGCQRKDIKQIVFDEARRVRLRSVCLGRLVIGPDYQMSLSGAEWPPAKPSV